jgi:DNA-binding MarR family transcriptional regulator
VPTFISTHKNYTGKLHSLPALISCIVRDVGNEVDPTLLASELRLVLGHLMRRLRAEHRFSLSQGAVLGRLDREGSRSIGDLALAERVRPQSMAQTVADLEADGLIARRPDPADGRRTLLELTQQGLRTLEADRSQREGWLAGAIVEDLSPAERQLLVRATELLRRLSENTTETPHAPALQGARELPGTDAARPAAQARDRAGTSAAALPVDQ